MDAGVACIDGQLVAVGEAVIPVTDQGLIRGDGVFEVIRLYGGRPYALDAHLARLERSAAGLRLPLDVDAVRADVARAASATRDWRRRPACASWCTRGGQRIALIEPMPEIPATLALEPITYAPTRMLDGIKSLSYGANMLASRLARERGADDALLVTPHGRVLECPTASFFLVRDGEFWTAPLSDHVLDSITRRVVLAVAAGARGADRRSRRSSDAQEAFVASSVHEVAPRAPRRRARATTRRGRARTSSRRSCASGSRPSCADADRHGRRQPAAVRQGGGRLRAAARAPRGDADPHRPAPRRASSRLSSSTSSGCRRPITTSASRAAPTAPSSRACWRRSSRCSSAIAPGRACCSTATPTRRSRARWPRPTAGLPAIPRRGGHALVRPHPARGAQPRAHRPALGAAAVLERSPRWRSSRRSRCPGAAVLVGDVMVDVALANRDARARARRAARRASGVVPGRLRARDRAPRRQRRRPRRARAARRRCSRRSRSRSCCRFTRGPARASPADGLDCARGARRHADRRRSATSTSPRCCTTPARC